MLVIRLAPSPEHQKYAHLNPQGYIIVLTGRGMELYLLLIEVRSPLTGVQIKLFMAGQQVGTISITGSASILGNLDTQSRRCWGIKVETGDTSGLQSDSTLILNTEGFISGSGMASYYEYSPVRIIGTRWRGPDGTFVSMSTEGTEAFSRIKLCSSAYL